LLDNAWPRMLHRGGWANIFQSCTTTKWPAVLITVLHR